MKQKIIIILIIIVGFLFISGCSISKENNPCNQACTEQGFSKGSCQTLNVIPNPCETELQQTTITSHEGYCPIYKRNGQIVDGIGNMCCCE